MTLPIRLLRWALLLLAAAAASFVVVYAAAGPLDEPVRARTPLNGVMFAAVGALLLMLLPRQTAEPMLPASPDGPRWHAWAVGAAIVLAYLPSLSFPLVSDGCTHVWWANQQTASPLTSLLTSPQEGRFFRPVSFYSYYLNSAWAGLDPAKWRLLNVTLHALNTVLVFELARALRFAHRVSLLAALLFGLHATRPEAVVWVGAHFEVLTTLFCFGSLLLWLRQRFVLSLAAALIAYLCKESAFILPVLLSLLSIAGRRGRPWQRAVWRTWPWYAAAVAVFAWRWRLLRGIGGYVDPHSSQLTILNFSPLHTAKALLLRMWTILTVPVNWSYSPEPWLVAAIAAGLAAVLWIAWNQSAPRASIALLALAALISVLPAQHLALIGQSMDGSRILYIASAPFCLLLALAAASSAPQPRAFVLCAAALIFLQGAALVHNLRIWGVVADLAHATVAETVRLIGGHRGPVGFRGVPNVVDGVYFIENGLPSCVALQGGPPVDHLVLETPRTPIPPDALILHWDPARRRMAGPAR